MKYLIPFLLIFIQNVCFSQEKSTPSNTIIISKYIEGTLLTPIVDGSSLAIIIADSGPIDRDGNQDFQKNNNLKKLAVALTSNGIATFRYDKRIVKQIIKGALDPKIRFDDFVNDAIDVISYFKKQRKFKKIYVIGHSQGSLIGMLASQNGVDGLISVNGSGKTIDALILEQVQLTAPMFTEDTKRVVEVLKDGKTTTKYPPALASIFDVSVQPFMASWMAYDPIEVIKTVKIPILLISGTKDLQVNIEEAKLLNAAAQNSELKLIDKMNHVLFIIEGGDQENAKSYNDHAGKISEELISTITNFIKK